MSGRPLTTKVKFLDLTLPTPEENLALDEALLLTAEADATAEYLRVWESPCYFVVLGKNCRVADDVYAENCRADGVPILRRVSGGGTVLQGPGCLNFAVVLRYDRSTRLVGVQDSFDYVLEYVLRALCEFDPRAERAAPSDLVIEQRKFSGNSQRRQRSHVLHQGSILHHFDIAAIPCYLREPRRRPPYRTDRPHVSFLTNLHASSADLRSAIRATWSETEWTDIWPRDAVARLVAVRYSQASWNLKP